MSTSDAWILKREKRRKESRKELSYTALYRKYRPSRFEDLLGQEHIVRTLKNQLVNGKVSHAYLFCGTRGTGKTTTAKIFAKAINCLSPDGGEPCGKCKLCAEIENGRSLNVIEIDAASNNGVENIREIREEVRYAPAEGNFKVYIIDEVHMLSASAYNAFLKTLEEPPAHVVFILATTDPQKIPATVLSRCQRYDFKRIGRKLVEERLRECLSLENVCADAAAIGYVASLSDGSMRDALSLMDRCASFFEGEEITLQKVLEITGSIDTSSFFTLTERLNELDCRSALAIVDEIVRDGKDINQIIMEAISHFRDILIAKTVESPAKILDASEESAERLAELGAKTEIPRIMSYINAFSELQASSRSQYALSRRLLLEVTLIKLCNPEISDGTNVEILNKLHALEKKIESGAVTSVSEKAPAGKDSEPVAEKPPRKKKVLLPGSFGEAKKRYLEVIDRLLAEREGLVFGSILKRTQLGFLDNKSIYVIFEDEPNEGILRDSPKKLEMLKRAFEDVTGKTYEIKTITRESFEKESNGITLVGGESAGEKLLESVNAVFGEFDALE